MIVQHLNWIAVLVSGLAYFSLGAIWFNPKVFGAMWAKGHSMDWMMGAKIGLVISGGSAFVSVAMTHIYTKKSTATIIVDGLHHILGAIICGIILSVWR